MVNSKKRYATLFFIFLILYVGFRGRTLFLALSVLIVLPVISVIAAKKLAKSLQINISFERDMLGRGAANTMLVELDNKLYIASAGVTVSMELCNSLYSDTKEVKIDIPVKGIGKNFVEVEVSSENSGFVYGDNVTVIVEDMLSLASFKEKKESNSKFMVIPSYIYAPADEKIYKPEDDGELLTNNVGEDTSEIESIREYIPGDRMQRIHWKLSSKMEDIMVKEYAMNYDIDVSLVCELTRNKRNGCLDPLLDAIYSMMNELDETNERYSVCFANKSHDGLICLSITSKEDIMDAIAQIYYIKPSDDNTAALTMAKAQGITPAMNIRWSDGKEDESKLLYEFQNKVVLVWE